MSAWATEILPGSEKGRASECGCWGVRVCARMNGGAKGPPLVDSLTDDMH